MTLTKNIYRAWGLTAGISFATMISVPFLENNSLENLVEQPVISGLEDTESLTDRKNSILASWLTILGISTTVSFVSVLAVSEYGHRYELERLEKEKEFSKLYASFLNPNSKDNGTYSPDPSKILI